MKQFKIRFVTEPDFISNAIREFTASLWSHVEICLEDGTYLGAHNPAGVQIWPTNYCKPLRERRYAIDVEDSAFTQMMDFAHSQIGKSYDRTDIFGILLHRNWHQSSAWICSELVAAVAEAGGLFMLNVVPGFTHKITPEMLHLSPVLINKCYYSSGG